METNSGSGAPAQNMQQQKAEDLSSRFTGGAFANFGINFLMYFVTVITLGFAYPVMKCRKMRWEVRHTYINGRQLTFDGKAKSLYGKYMIWLLLSVVTLGIYYLFCMSINLVRWQTEHTHISGTEGGESKFTGSALGRFGVAFVSGLVTVVTLSFGMYWARCYKERWYAKHKIIDGLRVEFNGKGVQYFCKRIVWTLLTVVTLFVYSFWLAVKSKKWICSHTVFALGQQLPEIRNGAETDPAKQPKGPEYWGTLTEAFINDPQTRAAAKMTDGAHTALRIVFNVLCYIAMFACLALNIFIGLGIGNEPVVAGSESASGDTPRMIWGFIAFAVTVPIEILCFVQLFFMRSALSRTSEKTKLKRLYGRTTFLAVSIAIFAVEAAYYLINVIRLGAGGYAEHPLFALPILLMVVALIFLALCSVSLHRQKKLRNYFAGKVPVLPGAPRRKTRLGEAYTDLKKYREYIRYRKFTENAAKQNANG